MLELFIKVTCFLAVIYIAIIGALVFDTPQRCLMFLHWARYPLYPDFDKLEYYGFGHNSGRNIKIKTSDNVTIGAWHFLPKEYYEKHQLREQTTVDESVFDAALADDTYETILYLHGNAADRAAPWRVNLYKQLLNRFGKVNIIAIDYRGFGDSESTPSESGVGLDAHATLDWLNNRNVPNHRITLIGHSLGTGVATTLAYDMASFDKPAKALILKAGYTSMETLVFEYNVIPLFPVLSPIKHIPMLEQWILTRLMHKFDSLSKIEYIKCPLLIIYGNADMEIPTTNSHRLFQRVVSGVKNTSIDQLEKDDTITRTIIPNEAVVYSSNKSKAIMVQLEYAHHNNVGYFDYTYQSIKYILELKTE